ncbi:hypothetical protein GCM10009007_06720 [Formosimonas limnophila]|uniref:Uncharacterized protein n=1 Tax=Formosimonas limnophila TaxID=1384487 RepID=A0A8J3CLW0_9BURK|nr:hypothetical protein [Formosimonas limnophila]GHA68628.1 hypothetical protein GCM10009007_06720 [Formosimonas limnophila]
MTQINSKPPALYIALELIGFVLFGVAIYELNRGEVVPPHFFAVPVLSMGVCGVGAFVIGTSGLAPPKIKKIIFKIEHPF